MPPPSRSPLPHPFRGAAPSSSSFGGQPPNPRRGAAPRTPHYFIFFKEAAAEPQGGFLQGGALGRHSGTYLRTRLIFLNISHMFFKHRHTSRHDTIRHDPPYHIILTTGSAPLSPWPCTRDPHSRRPATSPLGDTSLGDAPLGSPLGEPSLGDTPPSATPPLASSLGDTPSATPLGDRLLSDLKQAVLGSFCLGIETG